jgi:hypothetical protein
MPALTHGRVRNGFNSLPRRICKTTTVKKCDGCTETCIITKPTCKITKSGNSTSRVNHYSNSSRKRSNALGTVGRSGAARRAIMRRVTTNNCTGDGCKNKDNSITKALCCNKEKCGKQ